MKIEHISIWVKDLEKMKTFYKTWFNGQPSEKYVNSQKQFSSYFLKFESGCRLELMCKTDIVYENPSNTLGFTHLAFSVGNKKRVDELTNSLRNKGFSIASEPRTTGDGYYESVILDPEGNRIEITK